MAGLLSGCVPTGNAIMAGMAGGAPPSVKTAAYTKASADGSRVGRLMYNSAYQDVALNFIKSGKGLLEPVYELRLQSNSSFDLVPDWDATTDLHKTLSATMSLLPMSATRTYASLQLAQIKRQQAEWLTDLQRTIREEISGRVRVTGGDVLALFSGDSKQQRRALGGGFAGQLLEMADPVDKSPYAAPFYSAVLKTFETDQVSFVVSPSFELVFMQQSLNLRLAGIAATAEVLGDKLSALQRYARAGGGRNDTNILLALSSPPISDMQRAYIVSMARALSGLSMRLNWYANIAGERTALAFMSVENFRGVEQSGGRLNASLDAGRAETIVATLSTGYTPGGGGNPFIANLQPVPPEQRHLYDITQLTTIMVMKPGASMFGPIDWSRSLGNVFDVVNAMCGVLLTCVEGGPAERQDYVQLVAVGSKPKAIEALRLAGNKAPFWQPFFQCDQTAAAVSGFLADYTAESQHAVETASCHFDIARQAYASTTAARRQSTRDLTRTAAAAFADARKELKLTTGLKTRPLD
ncbi:hypothetical protein [Azospirillum oleiclasticum]|uniref:Uncharacterized protein n=1 Tax=Azospirillum oleiclasticum TaxID=2735135 RepID=A0ABX2TC13_9PROT|nr:hypothetical protein [Azospirillum oleiclasticum]NYZ21340.1 hypothetical protein [Azospirillum oleiclasticum]